MDEIQVPLLTQTRCPESLRLQHSWLMHNQQTQIAHEALFQRVVTVKVAMEFIMMVKRTQICRTWNGRVDQEDEHMWTYLTI